MAAVFARIKRAIWNGSWDTNTHGRNDYCASRGDLTGFGEAFMPPYYSENRDSMTAFFDRIDVSKLLEFDSLDESIDYVFCPTEGDTAAKAAVDTHFMIFLVGNPANLFLNSNGFSHPEKAKILTSFTIGIDTIESMVRKAKAAAEFKILKIKLNGKNDIEVVKAIRAITKQELFVDANQAWSETSEAIKTSEMLVKLGVGLIEQPFRKRRD